jgi:hypothetical protein
MLMATEISFAAVCRSKNSLLLKGDRASANGIVLGKQSTVSHSATSSFYAR